MISQGILLFSRDEGRRSNFESLPVGEYHDFSFYRYLHSGRPLALNLGKRLQKSLTGKPPTCYALPTIIMGNFCLLILYHACDVFIVGMGEHACFIKLERCDYSWHLWVMHSDFRGEVPNIADTLMMSCL